MLVLLLALAAVAFALARTFVAQRITVPESVTYMSPALQPGGRVWIDKLSYRISSPRRGDIAALVLPGEDNLTERLVFLRIVALPGETVTGKGGRLLVGGAAAAGSYARGELPFSFGANRVPAGHYFVLADDRAAYPPGGQLEPVFWGTVPRRDIIGRVLPAGG